MYSRLQYISQGITANEQLDNIQSTLDAGCKWVQLRFKNGGQKELHDLAERVKKICAAYQSTFIMNDHTDIAKNVGADGVHLGLLDMSITEARLILGGNKIIGGTANTIEDVMKRMNEKCDYIGLGPFRFTPTKEKLSPVLGLEGISEVMKVVLSGEAHIPIYAIGGITVDDVPAVMKTGVFGVAVSGAITSHLNKKDLVQKFKILLHE